MSDLVKLLRESFVAYSPKGRKVRSFRLLEDILPGDRERIADELERFEQENADLRAKLSEAEKNNESLEANLLLVRQEKNRAKRETQDYLRCFNAAHDKRLSAEKERDDLRRQVSEQAATIARMRGTLETILKQSCCDEEDALFCIIENINRNANNALSTTPSESAEMVKGLVEALEEIRNNSKLWRVARIGGCDQYQGLPPTMRIIDKTLEKWRGGNENG